MAARAAARAPARLSLDLQVACRARGTPRKADVQRCLEQAYRLAARGRTGGSEVTVRVVDEDESRRLNRRFRGQDKATNVLAFPAGDPEAFAGLPRRQARPLGDLVICGPLVEREAGEQGKNPGTHFRHLLVHGMLHLLGYDHQAPRQAAAMEALETKVLAGLGVADPYRGG